MKNLAGKVCLITGAASGIGKATAQRFSEAGATLVLVDLNQAAGEQFAAELREQHSDALFIKANIADPGDCAHMIEKIDRHFGRLDVAFNNAGISDSGDQPQFHEYPIELWERLLAVNLSGLFFCLRFEIPLLLRSGGCIVNTASIQATKRYPGTPAYTAAKTAAVALTQMVANEYGARGIRCNAVAPGYIETPLNQHILASPLWAEKLLASVPSHRFGQPGEIAEAVLWLCSAQASYVNGTCLPVDGGVLVR